MKESVITMLEELIKQMESIESEEVCTALDNAYNLAIKECVAIIDRKITHIKQEIQA